MTGFSFHAVAVPGGFFFSFDVANGNLPQPSNGDNIRTISKFSSIRGLIELMSLVQACLIMPSVLELAENRQLENKE